MEHMSSDGETSGSVVDLSSATVHPAVFDNYRTKQHCITSQTLQTTILDGLGHYCESEQFSDIKIVVHTAEFKCHRIILAASCPYFKALFQHQSDHDILTLNDISPSGFTALRQYIYTGKIHLTEENVEDIFVAADFLQYRDLVEICASMLLQQLKIANCLRIMILADQHSCWDLLDEATRFALSHFHSVLWTQDFLNLPRKLFEDLIQHEHCHVDSECDILVAICRWVTANDLETVDEILQFCNLAVIENGDIEMCIENYPVLKTSGVMRERMEGGNPCDVRILEKVVERRKREVVVVIVKRLGRNSEPWPAPQQVVTQVLYYEPLECSWLTLTAIPFEDRDMYSATVLDNDVYISGGVINDGLSTADVTNDVWTYTTHLDFWSQVMPMLKARKNHASTALHHKLYVIGGAASGSHRLRHDGEVYESATDQWTIICSLSGLGGIANPAIVPLNGRIYVIGGLCSDPTVGASQNTRWRQYPAAQCYNPSTNEWTRLSDLSDCIQSMNLKPAGNECLPYLGFIIFVDEDPYSAQKRARTVKLYNPVTGTVEDFIGYHHNRFGGYCMYRDELVKTGGVRDSFSAHNLVYSYDMSQDCGEWTMWTPMPVRSSHHACFTLFIGNNRLNGQRRAVGGDSS